jgi:hypothetical protein
MSALILKTTRSQYGSPFDNDDYVVLRDAPCHWPHISATTGTARSPMVLDDHCTREAAIDSQSRLFSDTRRSHERFQSAVVAV